MEDNILKIVFFGDIVGPLGREAVKKYIDLHKEKDKIDFIIANGENTTHGKGLSLDHYKELVNAGINCLTSGNHFFNNTDYFKNPDSFPNAIRPLNFDKDVPGKGSETFLCNGIKIRVSNLIGRTFLNMAQSNPFYALDDIIKEDSDCIHIVDFHAEATGEKRIMGEYLDGRVTAIIGTHTHIQTNDAKILNKGSFYLTDAGMNAAYDSCLGCTIEPIIHTTITGIPSKHDVPRSGKKQVNGVILNVNVLTHKVEDYQLINEIYE